MNYMLPARLKPSLFKASKLSAFITLASLSIGSFGDNIYQVYQDAVANDPIIRAAAATLRAEQELKNVAFGQMLPQIGIEFNYIDSTEDNTPIEGATVTLTGGTAEYGPNYLNDPADLADGIFGSDGKTTAAGLVAFNNVEQVRGARRLIGGKLGDALRCCWQRHQVADALK